MNIERLNELKAIVLADISAEYDCDDLTDILNREIHRIESRRKVPLVPCKCGRKRIEQWHKYIAGEGREGFIYQCVCGAEGKVKRTDNEARLAWNEKMGKDGEENE